MKNIRRFARYGSRLAVAAALVAVLLVPMARTVRAAAVPFMRDTLSRLKASTLATHVVEFEMDTALAAGETITLTFETFSMGTFAVANADFEIKSGTCESVGTYTQQALDTAASGATWGVGQIGQVISFISGTGTISAGLCVRATIGDSASFGGDGADQITNPAAGQYAVTLGGTNGDTGTTAVRIISDDQVSITADVAQSLTFTLSDNSIGFGTLTSLGTRWATGDALGTATADTVAHTLAASTNAGNGYAITVQGATLTHTGIGGVTITAVGGTPTAASSGSEQFGVRYEESGGSGTVSTPYDEATNYAYDGATAADQIASSVGPSITTTYSAIYIGNISLTTEAGSYSTALTYVATGEF